MDGIHDLGGKHGFGGSLEERDEGVFHADWERRAFAIASLYMAQRHATVDAFRHAIERLDPVAYLADGYFGRWLGAIELLVADAAGRPKVDPDGTSDAKREIDREPRFRVGQVVRTRNLHTAGHTRLPAYARSKTGTIVLLQGGWVLPDSNAHRRGENPEYAYAVRFAGEELWGDAAEPGTSVTLDLFESYLESELESQLELAPEAI